MALRLRHETLWRLARPVGISGRAEGEKSTTQIDASPRERVDQNRLFWSDCILLFG